MYSAIFMPAGGMSEVIKLDTPLSRPIAGILEV
jgi:hypothetical protein